MGKQWKQWHFIFLGSSFTVDGDCSHEIKRLAPWKKSSDIALPTKVHIVKVVTYTCESWTVKKAAHWRIDPMVLEKTFESPLDYKIKSVNPKGNQLWIFIGKTDAQVEALILWPPDAKSQLIRKDPDAGKDWGKEEKGVTEDKMVGSHHQLNGHEFEQTQEIVKDRETWCATVRGLAKSQRWLSNWTTTTFARP